MPWNSHTIKDIGTSVGGATPSTGKPSYWNGDIPWTTSKKLGGSAVLTDGERFISKEGLDNSSTNLVPPGNLLIATRVGVGKVAVNAKPMAISQDLTGIVIDASRFDPVFLAFCLSQSSVQLEFQRRARGVTIKGIPRDDLRVSRSGPRRRANNTESENVCWRLRAPSVFKPNSYLQWSNSGGPR